MPKACDQHLVADWSQAKIGYTRLKKLVTLCHVADWSQAKIGYTRDSCEDPQGGVADWSQAKIGYTTHAILTG